MTRGYALALCLAILAGCANPATPVPAPKPLVSGLDLTSFDKAVRPQDDLFLHVNGDWLTKTEIPADKASYGAFDLLFDKAQPPRS